MIDLHNDALLELPEDELLPYLQQAKQEGLDEVWLSVWTTRLSHPLQTIKNKQALLQQIAGDANYPLCHLHVEDAWFLTPENLGEFIAIHPESVGLTWNSANRLAGGAYSHAGITAFGRTVIKHLEAAGIQIDTAHLNQRSFWQFADITTRPMLCTHTACDAIRHHPRNLTDRQIAKILATGGKVGLCLVSDFLTKHTISCGTHDILKHINHLQNCFGAANFYWGTDFYGTEHLPLGIKNYRDIRFLNTAQIIGYSVLKQPLLTHQFGNVNAQKRILITAGMHAREWITTLACHELMALTTNLPTDTTIMFVPNCNPDGALLATTGLTPIFRRRAKFLQRVNHHQSDFKMWKANARAVDLNVNFAAGWGQGAKNITTPAPANFIGRCPNSEPETQALLKLIKQYRPTASLALHSKGEVIYYSRDEDRAMAKKLAQVTGYRPALSVKSFGGLTDYLALRCGIPAWTIEVGADTLPHPLDTSTLPDIVPKLVAALHLFNGA